MSPSGRACWSALLPLVLLASACGGIDEGSRADRKRPGTNAYSVASHPRTVRVVAVGDIACEPGRPVEWTRCRQAATAALAQQLRPDLVLTLGDHQYEKGTLAEYDRSYAQSWGALLSRTRPALGNHEYGIAGASGYYTYFRSRQPGPPGYYRVAARRWNIYVLNSNCDQVSCRAEARWLNAQMKVHPSKCSLVTMHHPRYSSGREHGNTVAVKPLWKAAYRHRNELVLSGHDHDYERFRPMNARGQIKRRRGMVEFVVGTGGKNLYHLGTRQRGSVYYQAQTPGVLFLALYRRAYSWSFRSIAGTVLDSGSRRCR
ncbi:MAG: hypothetical protein JWR85_2435 [Marmoricola sp.]|nr:hypothetical protein [Marmoricola sp.]